MFDKLEGVEKRYEELNKQIAECVENEQFEIWLYKGIGFYWSAWVWLDEGIRLCGTQHASQ